MVMVCGICGTDIELDSEPIDGQHVRCPYCNGKFSYRRSINNPSARKRKKTHNVDASNTSRNMDIGSIVRRVVIIAILVSTALFGFKKHAAYKQQKELEARQQIAAAQREAEAEARRQAEEAEAEARRVAENEARALNEKKDALEVLKAYLSREERLLDNAVDESKTEVSAIMADQQRLSAELLRIEALNSARQKEAEEKGWSRYDKAERLALVLKSDVVNELAVKYVGEDMTALLGEFRSKMKMVLKMDEMMREGLAKNREKYAKAVENIDADVTAKTQLARQQAVDANKDLEKRLAGLEESRQKKKTLVTSLKRQAQAKAIREEIQALEAEIGELDKEIARLSEVVAVSRSNLSHIAATEAETAARKKGDTALLLKTEDDNAVHAASAHERTVFSIATNYETLSLERIRNTMRSRKDMLSVRMHDAQQKLNYIHRASVNADMMNPIEIKNLRARIASRLSESIMDATSK